MRRLVGLVLIVLASCSAATTLVLRVNLLSFLTDAASPVEAIVPVSNGLAVYLLPGVQIDALDAGPDPLMREGSLVDLGFEVPASGLSIVAEIAIAVRVVNLGVADQVPPVTLEVWVASGDSEDVYGEGVLVANGVTASIAAGEDASLDLLVLLEEGEPGFQYVSTGAFRTAISLTMGPSGGSAIPIELVIDVIDVVVQARPFGVLE